MRWQIIIEKFGPKIWHIDKVDNIVADALSRLPSTPINKYGNCTRKDQCHANELFAIGRVKNNECYFPLNLLIVQRRKKNREIEIPDSVHRLWIGIRLLQESSRRCRYNLL